MEIDPRKARNSYEPWAIVELEGEGAKGLELSVAGDYARKKDHPYYSPDPCSQGA